MIRYFLLIVLLQVAIATCCVGQVLNNKLSRGLFLRPAISKGTNSGELNSLNSYDFLTGSIGIYGLIRVQSKESVIPIYYLKTELAFSNKKGVFDVKGIGLVGFNSNAIDLSLTLPLTVKISETLRASVGLGGNISYQTSRKIFTDSSPLPSLPAGNKIHFGLVGDFGFLVDDSSTALFGLRTLIEFADYPYAELGIYLGFGLQHPTSKLKN